MRVAKKNQTEKIEDCLSASLAKVGMGESEGSGVVTSLEKWHSRSASPLKKVESCELAARSLLVITVHTGISFSV